LTVHGVTKPVTLDVTLNFSGIQPMSKKQTLGIGAATNVSNEVSIEVQTEMFKKG
jgi:polyisoprenoid-binding protein YceI